MGKYLRKYGEATTVDFQLFETTGVNLKVDASHASGDTKIMKDEGTEANTTNGFVDRGQGYSIALTATEMQAARIVIYIVDQGTKAWLDTTVIIETYGNASAQHAFDLDKDTQDVNILQISGDSTAADNLESDYDGTGYSKSASTIANVTNVTNEVSADITKISGDSVAADNLEADYDGSGYNKTNSTIGTATNVTNEVSADAVKISGDSVAADNLESTYDGSGYENDYAPAQQQQISNLAIGSAAISTVADSVTITTGSETGTYVNTQARDLVYHQIADVGGTTDLYYEFDVGGNGIPVSVSFVGYVNGLNDSIKVYGYNWGTTTWEQIGLISGQAGTGDNELTFSMYSTHVGTGANLGKVRVRFQNIGLTTSNLAIDQLYVSYAVVVQSVGYSNGSIWVDTNNGTAGTVPYVNGTADNPVLTWADALSLSSSLGLTRFEISNGSSITLSGSITNYTLVGIGWTLLLNNKVISGASISGANVSGVGLNGGSSPSFIACDLGIVSLPGSKCLRCALTNKITVTEDTDYYFDQCFSGVAGTDTPVIDFGASVGNSNINFRHYSGGIEIENMGVLGTDNMSLEGHGQLIINANCDPSNSPVIAIRGHFPYTDNVVGGFEAGGGTISDDGRYSTSAISSSVWDEPVADHRSGASYGCDFTLITKNVSTTYYVSLNGSDSNDGLSACSPFLTIDKALTTASAGESIRIGKGVYYENGLTISNDYITIDADLGAVIASTTGYALTISSNANSINNVSVINIGTANGFLISGTDNLINFCEASACIDGYTVTGTRNFIRNTRSLIHSGSGYKITGTYNTFLLALSSDAGASSIGFNLSASSAKYNVFTECASINNNDSVIIVSGASENIFKEYVHSESENVPNDLGTNNIFIGGSFAGKNVADEVLSEPTDLTNKSIGGMLYHLFSRFYHKVTQTATEQKVYKDDNTTVLGTMPTSDDGTTQSKGKAT